MTLNLPLEFAHAARAAAARAGTEKFHPEIATCHDDPDAFCEWVFQDDQTGEQLIQAPHHREWQRLTAAHDRLVMWFPIEHGKTTQAKMTMCRLLGRHPDRQYAYISSKAMQARKMLASVKREIESNIRLRMVYPDLKPQRSALTKAREEWGKTTIRVHGCPPGSRDASLSAYGLDGQILGSRLHGAIIDNVLDKANTRSRNMREWLLEVIEDEIMGRILPGGFIWVIDTAWFADDALHMLSKKPGWHSARFDALDGADGGTLWQKQFPADRLEKLQQQLGQTAFDRQFRNKPLSESMNFFRQEYWNAAYGRCAWVADGWVEGTELQTSVRTGVDLATRKGQQHDLTAMATVAARGSRRQLVHLTSARMEGMEILRALLPIFRVIHMPIIQAGGDAKFIVEDNAAQKYIIDMIRDGAVQAALGLTDTEAALISVSGRTTTAKRRDPELGIQGIASAIEMGRWDFAADPEVRALRDEMNVWSPESDHYGDRLMALWQAASDLNEVAMGFKVDFI